MDIYGRKNEKDQKHCQLNEPQIKLRKGSIHQYYNSFLKHIDRTENCKKSKVRRPINNVPNRK